MSETPTITQPPAPEATAQTPPPPAPDNTAQQSSTTEQQVPPTAPPQPEQTTQAEQERNAEILRGRQKDVGRITDVVLKRKLQAALPSLRGKTPEEKSAYYEQQEPALGHMKTIYHISHLQDTRAEKVDKNGEHIPLLNSRELGDTKIQFKHKDETTGQENNIEVRQILSVNGDYFYIESTNGEKLEVSRDIIAIAVTESESEFIVDDLSDDEQALLHLYIEQTNNPNILMEAGSRDIMERVATDVGLLRVDDLQAMVNKGMENIDISDENQKVGMERKKQLDALQDILDADRVLATADTVEKALTLMGSGKKGYEEEKARLTAEKSRLVAEKSAYIDKNSKDADILKHIEDLTKQIEDNESQLDVVERVLSVVDNHEAIAKLANAVTDGNTLQEVAVNMVKAIRNNNWDQMLNAHPDLREDENDTPEMRRKKAAMREQYKKMGKAGGLGLLFLLSLLAEVMPEAMK